MHRHSSSVTAEREAKDYATLGNKHAEQGNYLEAIHLYSEAFKLNHKDYRFLGNRSFCYEQVGNYEKALSDSFECLRIHPTWPKGHFRKGKALQGLKQYREAVDVFDQVLAYNTDCSEASEAKFQASVLYLQNLGYSPEHAAPLLEKYGSLDATLRCIGLPSKVSNGCFTTNPSVLHQPLPNSFGNTVIEGLQLGSNSSVSTTPRISSIQSLDQSNQFSSIPGGSVSRPLIGCDESSSKLLAKLFGPASSAGGTTALSSVSASSTPLSSYQQQLLTASTREDGLLLNGNYSSKDFIPGSTSHGQHQYNNDGSITSHGDSYLSSIVSPTSRLRLGSSDLSGSPETGGGGALTNGFMSPAEWLSSGHTGGSHYPFKTSPPGLGTTHDDEHAYGTAPPAGYHKRGGSESTGELLGGDMGDSGFSIVNHSVAFPPAATSPPLSELFIMNNSYAGSNNLSQNSNLGDSGKSSESADLSGSGGFLGINKSSFPDLTGPSLNESAVSLTNGYLPQRSKELPSEFAHHSPGRQHHLLASEALMLNSSKDSKSRSIWASGDRPLSSSDSSVVSGGGDGGLGSKPRIVPALPKLVVKQPVKAAPLEANMDPANLMKVATLWIGNLQADCNKKQILSMFSKYGTIKSSNFMLDNHCAFINYYDYRAASDAMRGLQNTMYDNFRLKIKFPDRMLGAAATVLRKSQPAVATTTTKTPSSGALSTSNNNNANKSGFAATVNDCKSAAGQPSAVKTTKTTTTAAKTVPTVPMTAADHRRKGPLPNGECYFWRTTGCRYEGKCAHIHKPENKAIDKKLWML